MIRSVSAVVSLAALFLTAGCVPTSPPSDSSSSPSSSATASPDPIAGLSLAQRVGQLFMVGSTASAAEQVTLDSITHRHVGNIFLSGRSSLGVPATASVVSAFTALANAANTANQPLLVATDQEGGQVQVLTGPGFSALPAGLQQGALAPAELRSSARTWAAELHAAGVNMDLAPVVDLVGSASAAATNPPIGAFHREFGFSATTIVSHADAFRDGMSDSGVETVIKHFPGLGFVTANTDVAAGVTDDVTGADGADVGIYRSEIAAGARTIMVSSAIYSRIDPSAPAIFSPVVVTQLLRQSLGFRGVIMSDDLSGATQVAAWTPGDRAVLAIRAGADIVLVSKDPGVAAQMVDAVLAEARSDPAFATLVNDAARRVIDLKSDLR